MWSILCSLASQLMNQLLMQNNKWKEGHNLLRPEHKFLAQIVLLEWTINMMFLILSSERWGGMGQGGGLGGGAKWIEWGVGWWVWMTHVKVLSTVVHKFYFIQETLLLMLKYSFTFFYFYFKFPFLPLQSFNSFTLRNDQEVFSPWSVNTLLRRQMVRITKMRKQKNVSTKWKNLIECIKFSLLSLDEVCGSR